MLHILAGATTGNFTVTIIDDGVNEGLKSFYVRLGNPVNAAIGDGEGENDNRRQGGRAVRV